MNSDRELYLAAGRNDVISQLYIWTGVVMLCLLTIPPPLPHRNWKVLSRKIALAYSAEGL
jgi:hypothetical protein